MHDPLLQGLCNKKCRSHDGVCSLSSSMVTLSLLMGNWINTIKRAFSSNDVWYNGFWPLDWLIFLQIWVDILQNLTKFLSFNPDTNQSISRQGDLSVGSLLCVLDYGSLLCIYMWNCIKFTSGRLHGGDRSAGPHQPGQL